MSNSKESKTVTTDNVDEEKHTPTESFQKVLALLQEIAKKLPETEKAFDPVSYLINSLKPSDVLIEYKIIAHSKNGEIFNIEGINNLPRLFDESMLPEAPSNFENTFNASIIRPALNAFMKYTREKVEEYKKPTASASALTLPFTDQQDFISE
jgi:hypothetical protein